MHCCRNFVFFAELWLPDWLKSLRSNSYWQYGNQVFTLLVVKTSFQMARAFVLSYQLFFFDCWFFTAQPCCTASLMEDSTLISWFLHSFYSLISLSDFWSPNRLYLQVTIADRWQIFSSQCISVLLWSIILCLHRAKKKLTMTKRPEDVDNDEKSLSFSRLFPLLLVGNSTSYE